MAVSRLVIVFGLVAAVLNGAPGLALPASSVEQVKSLSLSCHDKALADGNLDHPCYGITSTLSVERGRRQCKATVVYRFRESKQLLAAIFMLDRVVAKVVEGSSTAVRLSCSEKQSSNNRSKRNRTLALDNSLNWLGCIHFVQVDPDGALAVKTYEKSATLMHFLDKDRDLIVDTITSITRQCVN